MSVTKLIPRSSHSPAYLGSFTRFLAYEDRGYWLSKPAPLISRRDVFARFASPYERRLAIREDLGFYNSVAIGAVYEFDNVQFDVRSARSFVWPLRRCVVAHPYMNVVMKDKQTENPFWEGVSKVNFKDHIRVIHDEAPHDSDETALIEQVLPSIVDEGFTVSTPPWRIVVLPLPSRRGETKPRCFIAFAFSHSIGDGGAALAFHRTFLHSLRQDSELQDDPFTVAVPGRTLPDPFDTAERLPVSPNYLRSIANDNIIDTETWTGSPVFSQPGEGLRTRIRLLEIEASLLNGALRASRAHQVKLTPTIHELIARALSKVVTDYNITNFVSQTAIDLRDASNAGLEWGIYVSGLSTAHPRVDASNPFSNSIWAAARSMSERLAEVGGRLHDQPIGLLRHIPSQRESLVNKLGGKREGSYALSNLGAFDGGHEGCCRIDKMVVGTSAAVPSTPLSFCIMSVKGGSLMCAVSWQPGALGRPIKDEAFFVDEICSSLRADFEALGAAA